MKEKRGRPAIKPSIRGLIFEYAVNRKQMPRLALAVELKNLIEEMGEIPPSEETMIRHISKARNHPVSPLDSPWSVGCLGKYDIPPEALPKVMFIYEKRLREAEQHFTIREALWIARLHKIIDNPIILERFASGYALRDQTDWILNSPVYTRDFDISVIRYMNGQITAADIVDSPGRIHPLPTWGRGEDEELEKKLRKKGYTLGIELTEKEGGTK